MKIAYLDCFSGLSGDMVLGALLDIGVDQDTLREELAKLPLTRYAMTAKPATRGGIGSTKVSVKAVEKGLVRTYNNIRQVIEESGLEAQVKERSLAIFQMLAQAQAKINRKNVETIHFHEVGAVDSIVDIVGTAIGFSVLGVDRVYCSPLPMGLGMKRTEHGMMPIPSPVTLEILTGVPIYSTGIQTELVTPTGAAIARSFVHEFINIPPITVEKIGYGAGREEFEAPNVLRLVTGALNEPAMGDMVVWISVGIANPKGAAATDLMRLLVNAGALDVWITPVIKLDAEDGAILHVVASIDKEEAVTQAVFAETSTDDIRITRQIRQRRS